MESLYHYTTLEASLSILKGRKLWLTSAHNLNDHQEVNWMYGKIAKQIEFFRGDYSDEAIRIVSEAIIANRNTPYICSFSTNPDLLSQWRAYASDGTGFAIGFNRSALPRIDGLPHLSAAVQNSTSTHSLIYQEVVQDDLVRNFLRTALEAAQDPTAQHSGKHVDFILNLVALASVCKNPAFVEEAEVRMIHLPLIHLKEGKGAVVMMAVSEPKFRISCGRLATYFEYDIPKDAITEVVLGPKCQVSGYDLTMLLSSTGYPNVTIRRSSASYR